MYEFIIFQCVLSSLFRSDLFIRSFICSYIFFLDVIESTESPEEEDEEEDDGCARCYENKQADLVLSSHSSSESIF